MHTEAAEDQEREIALALGSVAPETVLAHPLVAARAIDSPVEERLVSTYYDTADRALAARGIVLRVRQGPRGTVQTVKRGGPKGAGLAARDEWETPLAGPEPLWPPPIPGETGDALARIAGKASLAPLFVTDFTRRRCRLAAPDGGEVEVAADSGEIRAGDRRWPVAEVELELKRGDAAALFDLALDLCRELPLTLQMVSKGERGLMLADGSRPRAVTARRPVLDRAMTVADAFAVLLSAAAGHAASNVPAIVEQSAPVEGVHQMRVGLRRLRAGLALFKRRLAKRERAALRRLIRPSLDRLGPMRDLDVFVDETLPPVLAAFPGDEAVAAFHTQACTSRLAARTALAAFLATPECSRDWLAIGRWLAQDHVDDDGPVTDFARKVLRKCARRVKRAAKEAVGGPPDALHVLRIEVKKLRYAGEFFAAPFDEADTRPVLKALRRAQDALGRLNDVAVCDAVAAQVRADAPDDPLVARGAGIVAGFVHARAAAARTEAEAAYAAFARLRPFWK